MPNWVYNNMIVSGAESEVKQFIADMSKPIKTHKPNPESKWESIQGEWDIQENVVFSFWNAIAPEDEILHDYFTSADNKAPANNWYGWNNINWGTKWDARVDENTIDELDQGLYADGKYYVTYRFETAWGAPDPVFIALADKYKNLDFDIEWEEEQGFGAEYEARGGDLRVVREWDIPQSHADYVEQSKEDSCYCAIESDEDDWFDDCPKSEEDENRLKPVADLTTVS